MEKERMTEKKTLPPTAPTLPHHHPTHSTNIQILRHPFSIISLSPSPSTSVHTNLFPLILTLSYIKIGS
ncbi:hypothetical protein L1887_30174 [Cichorium endivia]|nr:hypothetical protein L1887_30174 [Cichorium endivia]